MRRTHSPNEDGQNAVFWGSWHPGNTLLSACCSDVKLCLTATFCPCVVYKEIRNILHGGFYEASLDPAVLYCLVCVNTGCCCILGTMNRNDIRAKYGLPPTPCNDCTVHACCHSCALCQEARELRLRPLTIWPPTPMPEETGLAIGSPVKLIPSSFAVERI